MLYIPQSTGGLFLVQDFSYCVCLCCVLIALSTFGRFKIAFLSVCFPCRRSLFTKSCICTETTQSSNKQSSFPCCLSTFGADTYWKLTFKVMFLNLCSFGSVHLSGPVSCQQTSWMITTYNIRSEIFSSTKTAHRASIYAAHVVRIRAGLQTFCPLCVVPSSGWLVSVLTPTSCPQWATGSVSAAKL